MDFLKKAVSEYASGENNNNYNQQQQGDFSQKLNQYTNQNAPQGYGGQGEYNTPSGGFGQQGGYDGQQQQQQQFQGGNQGGAAAGFFGAQGGEQYNRPHGGGGAGGFGGVPNVDQHSAIAAANANANDQDSSLFSSAMSHISNMNKHDNHDVDDDDVIQKHEQAYQQGNAGGMSANSMGTAAAMQAMKMFTQGQGNTPAEQTGGNMQSKMIGMAMSEAAKLFDQSGGAAAGNKQDAVNSAGTTIMKLLLKSQFSGTTGGANSGGLGSMLSMASKFMQ